MRIEWKQAGDAGSVRRLRCPDDVVRGGDRLRKTVGDEVRYGLTTRQVDDKRRQPQSRTLVKRKGVCADLNVGAGHELIKARLPTVVDRNWSVDQPGIRVTPIGFVGMEAINDRLSEPRIARKLDGES